MIRINLLRTFPPMDAVTARLARLRWWLRMERR